ncbi:ATP-binding protein [Streptomyces sp. NBC_01014]|uniref:ATP-binding protein n=1 Tax=Streptomyces sp. NBC_01014 TaxID=2903719 RepID=UPI00386F8CFF|nr:ATP-binding protein [Streptomyces sp. NBC_01014]
MNSAVATPFAPAPEKWECSLQLTNDPRAPRVARRTVRGAILDFALDAELADTAELLTSELVTNAVQHSDGPVLVQLGARRGVVRVCVWDNHPELPDPLPETTEDPFGRGLLLVERLADGWGRYPLAADGKVVWFELVPKNPWQGWI